MKYAFLSTAFLLFLGFALSVKAQTFEKTDRKAFISFKSGAHDFDKVLQGDKVEHTFVFENTGDYPLMISNVKTTCGCTVPEWPHEPIAPGEEHSIKVVFDSKGKKGRQRKVITVISNAENSVERISLSGDVLEEDSANEE